MVLKRRFIVILALLLALGAAATGRAGAPEGVPVSEYIRLHVVAEDDGEAAQALKLKVRDACLEAARALLRDCDSADAAWETLNDGLESIEAAALERAREEGYEGELSARTGVFSFPDRRYGGVFVPAGEYRALRVVIGAGEGHNWWCVLYPSLCLGADAEPGQPVEFRSAILEWLKRLFGGDGA